MKINIKCTHTKISIIDVFDNKKSTLNSLLDVGRQTNVVVGVVVRALVLHGRGDTLAMHLLDTVHDEELHVAADVLVSTLGLASAFHTLSCCG